MRPWIGKYRIFQLFFKSLVQRRDDVFAIRMGEKETNVAICPPTFTNTLRDIRLIKQWGHLKDFYPVSP